MIEPCNNYQGGARGSGDIAVVYAGDYVNKLSGERIERECRNKLDAGCRTLIINFKGTELVNSIGVSILLGVIDAAEETGAHIVFAEVNRHTIKLFDLLGLTRHVALADNEDAVNKMLAEFAVPPANQGH
ncbi:MAG TPA: STAS domain-containing protein [Pyrinomonadaceae bacterium]|jgi:anti-anti-sigma factor